MSELNLYNNDDKSAVNTLAMRLLFELTKPDFIQSLLSTSKEEIIGNLTREMEAKNEAYFYILDRGLLDDFISLTNTNPAASTDFARLIRLLYMQIEQKDQQLSFMRDQIVAARRDIDFYQEYIENMGR